MCLWYIQCLKRWTKRYEPSKQKLLTQYRWLDDGHARADMLLCLPPHSLRMHISHIPSYTQTTDNILWLKSNMRLEVWSKLFGTFTAYAELYQIFPNKTGSMIFWNEESTQKRIILFWNHQGLTDDLETGSQSLFRFQNNIRSVVFGVTGGFVDSKSTLLPGLTTVWTVSLLHGPFHTTMQPTRHFIWRNNENGSSYFGIIKPWGQILKYHTAAHWKLRMNLFGIGKG